jgi:hypothetical protein
MVTHAISASCPGAAVSRCELAFPHFHNALARVRTSAARIELQRTSQHSPARGHNLARVVARARRQAADILALAKRQGSAAICFALRRCSEPCFEIMSNGVSAAPAATESAFHDQATAEAQGGRLFSLARLPIAVRPMGVNLLRARFAKIPDRHRLAPRLTGDPRTASGQARFGGITRSLLKHAARSLSAAQCIPRRLRPRADQDNSMA